MTEWLPLVSIIIPVYNGANYMREAIDSALGQTYSNIEVLVVNDGSADDGKTEEIALSYGDRITYYKKENGGVSSALNWGIGHMKGEYFSWLSHDDVYTPDKVQLQVDKLRTLGDPEMVVLCSADTINKDSVKIGGDSAPYPDQVLSWREAVSHISARGANGCALLIPKTVFDKVGGFDENLRYCQDILMWWNIFLAGYSLAFCREVGVHYRVHGQQLTQTGSAVFHRDAAYMGEILPQRFAAISDREENCLYVYARREAIYGNRGVVKKCVRAAREKGLFTLSQRFTLGGLVLYGMVRPLIRKVYYKVFRNIEVK